MVVKALFKLLHGASIVSDVGIEDGLPAWPIGFARASFELFLPEAPQTTCLERGMQACNLGGCTTVRFEVGRKGVQRHTFRFVSLSHPVVRGTRVGVKLERLFSLSDRRIVVMGEIENIRLEHVRNFRHGINLVCFLYFCNGLVAPTHCGQEYGVGTVSFRVVGIKTDGLSVFILGLRPIPLGGKVQIGKLRVSGCKGWIEFDCLQRGGPRLCKRFRLRRTAPVPEVIVSIRYAYQRTCESWIFGFCLRVILQGLLETAAA